MKPRTFFRHIKAGFQNVGRNGWMSFAAILAVAITLLMAGVFVAVFANAQKISQDVESDVSIRAYVDLAADDSDIQDLEEDLNAMDQVASVEFSNKDEELEKVQGAYGDSFEVFEGDENPLRHVFVVNAQEPSQTGDLADSISELNYISDVNYGGADAERLFTFVDRFQVIGLVVGIVLIIAAIFLIGNTIRATIFSRQNEIEIMKLVGATDRFIRRPFRIEGMIIGFIGALIPAVVIYFAYDYIYSRVSGALASTSLDLLQPNPFLYYLIAGLLIFGIIIGSLSASLSIRRFLKV